MKITTIPRIIQANVQKNPNFVAQFSKDADGVFKPTSFAEMYGETLAYAAGLREIGIKRNDHVGLISDNRKEWLITSLALHCLGAADVPRGCDTMAQEMAYILSFADCKSAVLENEAQLIKVLSLKEKIPAIERLIIIDSDFDQSKYKNDIGNIKIFSYKEIMERGTALTADGSYGINSFDKSDNLSIIEAEIAKGKPEDLATIIFTSGTTGEPKGVMLNHASIINQAENAPKLMGNGACDIWLSVLPVWHSFERAIQYIALYYGGAIAYSKPTGKIMLADLQAVKPQFMAAVPRIWEALCTGIHRNISAGSVIKRGLFNFFLSIGDRHEKTKNLLLNRMPQYHHRAVFLDVFFAVIPFLLLSPVRGLGNVLVFKKIKAMLGGKFKTGISGGASLPTSVDQFFAAAGIQLLEGYGLTETAPILAVRNYKHPVLTTIGCEFPNMKIEIRDPDTGKIKAPGKNGILFAKGIQVMTGYYKKPEETAKVIDQDGWFNTGDIGKKTVKGEIRLTGRAKDTIVLLGGENVEPVPIENKLKESEYIDQAVVVGQDKKYLAALVVPNMEKIEAYIKENAITYVDAESIVQLPEVRDLIQTEISNLVHQKTGFRSFEMVFRSFVLSKPFEAGKELSAKQDLKRHAIAEIYKKEIAQLFED